MLGDLQLQFTRFPHNGVRDVASCCGGVRRACAGEMAVASAIGGQGAAAGGQHVGWGAAGFGGGLAGLRVGGEGGEGPVLDGAVAGRAAAEFSCGAVAALPGGGDGGAVALAWTAWVSGLWGVGRKARGVPVARCYSGVGIWCQGGVL